MECVFTLILLGLVPALNGQVCDPADFNLTGIVLPTLPDQFSVRVEANFLDINETLIAHEVYDNVNNRGSLSIRSNGSFYRSIYDYDNNEIFVFPDIRTGRECTVTKLSQSPFINFTLGVVVNDDGSIHIGTPSQFLENLKGDTPTRYMGLDTIRGIPVLRWQSCFDQDNVSYTADYYYTTPDWDYAVIGDPSFYEMIPLQIMVSGQSALRNIPLHNFTHVYSLFDYRSGPDSTSERHFSVPTGLACVGRIPGIPTPQIPRFFTTYVQYSDTSSSEKTVGTAREYYDIEHNLFRIDAYYDGRSGGEAGPYQIIHDFNSQVQYSINRHTSNCTASPLGSRFLFFDEERNDDDGDVQLISPNSFFFLGNEFNYSYEGVSTVRGVEVDSWIAIRDFSMINAYSNLTNAVYEVFFTRPEYNISTDRSAGASVLPWRVQIGGLLTFRNFSTNETQSRNASFIVDLFDFSTTEPPYDSFDASICFTDDQLHTLVLVFKAPIIGVDFKIFRTNLRASLVRITFMSPLQISNILIVNSNMTHFFVALHLVNNSEHATFDDEERIVTADEALSSVLAVRRDDRTIPLDVDVGNGLRVDPTLIIFQRGRNTTCQSMNTTCPNNSSCNDNGNITNRLKLTDAIVAGIAVGLFFAGLLLGLLLAFTCWCCVKCLGGKGSMNVSSGASTVKYQKQDDELNAFS